MSPIDKSESKLWLEISSIYEIPDIHVFAKSIEFTAIYSYHF